ncbi:MAG: hypothetical protein ACR2RV_21440 [Verrucomicrobiales bacterium]
MSMFRQFPAALALAAALSAAAAGLLTTPIARAQGGDPYSGPDFSKQLFTREAVLLETQEIASVVSALTALAANFPASSELDHQLRAKALAIALGLDGTHPGALATHASLKNAELPAPVSDFSTLGEIAEQIWLTASYLESPEMGEDEQVLQFCLVDIARDIDSANLAESNRYPARLAESMFPGWDSFIKGAGNSAFVFPDKGQEPPVIPDPAPGKVDEPDPDTGAKPPVIPPNAERAAQGTYRSITISGSTPALAPIGGDLKTSGSTAPMAVIFSDEEGDTGQPLNDNRGALVSALTKLHGSWPEDGGVVVLTVNSADAGDQAMLLPSAILADSLIRERELAPGTLALGFVDPDGNLLRVEQLHDRLADFKANEIDTILLPEENLPDLRDMALLGELTPFFRYQFILVSNLGEAVDLAAEQRDEDFEANLRSFKLVQDVAKDAVLTSLTGFTAVQSTFGKITELNPKHASAVVLLEHGAEKLPEHLTRRGSLEALRRITGPVVQSMLSPGGSAEPDAVADALEAVEKVRPILDPEIAPLGKMMGALLKDIGRFAKLDPQSGPAANELKDKILSTWETVREEFGRLKNSGG